MTATFGEGSPRRGEVVQSYDHTGEVWLVSIGMWFLMKNAGNAASRGTRLLSSQEASSCVVPDMVSLAELLNLQSPPRG